MNQVIQLSQPKFEELIQRVSRLEKIMTKLLEKIDEPVYGTDKWWEKEEKKATQDIKEGRYKIFNKSDDLIEDLHKSLK